MFTDPIADMLTRIRNAGRAGHAAVLMPNSRVKTEIARVLQAQGYVVGYRHHDGVGAGIGSSLPPCFRFSSRSFS